MSRKPSRPSPRINLLPRPPLSFDAFSDLLKAIGQTMDDLGILYEASSDYVVSNEGEVVTLRERGMCFGGVFHADDECARPQQTVTVRTARRRASRPRHVEITVRGWRMIRSERS